jgi:putative addiction module component (TIGR02574 family)
MILETLPDVQKLTADEKIILAEELLDDLNAPNLSGSQEMAILQVLNERLDAFSKGRTPASSWEEVQNRLREKTGAPWRR